MAVPTHLQEPLAQTLAQTQPLHDLHANQSVVAALRSLLMLRCVSDDAEGAATLSVLAVARSGGGGGRTRAK
eukprot:5884353-Pleurochrysis_carterae.AAC.5